MQTETYIDQATEIFNQLSAEDTVGEIVDTVLDAADVEILGGLGAGVAGADDTDGAAARAEAQGAVLLCQLMVDVLRRYRDRKRRELSYQGGEA